MESLKGKTFKHYNIEKELGRGGMAVVYKAYDTQLERNVAIKIISTDKFAPSVLNQVLKRFENEAKALAKLSHPNIVKVYEFGKYKGQPYLVMEYLPGETLKKRMGKPIPWKEAFRMLLPIADALAYAHDEGILHRDVKPTNILLNEKFQPMLTDFGIARIMTEEETTALTSTGLVMGTAEYMSPEQGMGKKVDKHSDIYSFGVVLYELLTGRKLFAGDSQIDVIFKHLNARLPDPRQYSPDIPDAVVQLLQRSLAKNPSDRFHNMNDLISMMNSIIEGKYTAKASGTKKTELITTGSGVAKHKKLPWLPIAIGIGGVLILCMIFSIIIFIANGGKDEPTVTPDPETSIVRTSELPATNSIRPTYTMAATSPPTLTPTRTTPPHDDPEIFLRNFFNTINKPDCNSAYEKLSQNYKDWYEKTANYNADNRWKYWCNYLNGKNGATNLTIYSSSMNVDRAHLSIKIDYNRDDGFTDTCSQEITLIWDSNKKDWLIDVAENTCTTQ
ncbi:serine/threonine-protein kinase [Chloroflexota bacterium]